MGKKKKLFEVTPRNQIFFLPPCQSPLPTPLPPLPPLHSAPWAAGVSAPVTASPPVVVVRGSVVGAIPIT